MAGAGIALGGVKVAGCGGVGQLKFVEAVVGDWLGRDDGSPEGVVRRGGGLGERVGVRGGVEGITGVPDKDGG